MRMVIWLVFSSSADRMKKGTAMSRKESMLLTILMGTAASGTLPLAAMATRAVRPSAKGTGTASTSRKKTKPPKIRMRPSNGVIGGSDETPLQAANLREPGRVLRELRVQRLDPLAEGREVRRQHLHPL